MPLVPNFLERLAMLRLNKAPGPFLDIMGGFSFYAVYSAIQLGIFERLDGASATPAVLADELGATERGLDILLEVLDSLGYVERRGAQYSNTEMTTAWMLEASPTCFSRAFQYYGDSMADLWPGLHLTVKTGRPEINFYDWLARHPEAGEQYQQFMMSLARMSLPEWRKVVRLPAGARRMIDIGGGHGLYSIALCRTHPQLEVTLFDSSYALDVARTNIEEAELEDRIALEEGDYLTGDMGSGYDVALLSNVIHQQTSEVNRELVGRIARALGDEGALIITDIVREKKMTHMMDFITRMYGLIFFLFLGGQNFTHEQIAGWLGAAGFAGITKRTFRSGSNLVVGRKAPAR